jgi:hypothetical protein
MWGKVPKLRDVYDEAYYNENLSDAVPVALAAGMYAAELAPQIDPRSGVFNGEVFSPQTFPNIGRTQVKKLPEGRS